MSGSQKFTVEVGHGRVDLWLVERFPEFSRSQIQNYLKRGHILLNGGQVKPKYSLEVGDVVELRLPKEEPEVPVAEEIPLEVLYEDEEVLVINKQPGLVVHPGAGNRAGTLVNALLYYLGGWEGVSSIGAPERPGIVHRLDKETSGCLVVAKGDGAHVSLVEQFASRQTSKLYLAVLQKEPSKEQDTVFNNIGRHPVNRQRMAVVNPGSGKPAITDYYRLSTLEDGSSLVLCRLHTGRTHQIRVHMKHVGGAILGDGLYTRPRKEQALTGRLMLHAWQLGFVHPASGKYGLYEAPIPEVFAPWLVGVELRADWVSELVQKGGGGS